MERLLKGYREFRKRRWPAERARYEELAHKGQKPEYLIIACSDSRSDPATIFNGRPGEFFIVRNIAAAVPPYEAAAGYYSTRAAIAFAVLGLNVRNIVVMGHAKCGGVAAAMDEDSASKIPFLREWVELLKPAIEASPECKPHDFDGCAEVERNTVKLSIERLMAYPFIAERVQAGTLTVNGSRFNITNGMLEILDRKTGKFAEPRNGLLSSLFGSAA